MGFTAQERVVLVGLGAIALAGLAALGWQRQRPSLEVVGKALATPTGQWNHTLQQARQVDINAAGVAELERLPQVGPALAQRIINYRNAQGIFRSPEELSRVKGIGPKTYEALEPYVIVK